MNLRVCCACCHGLPLIAAEPDWPQFRGPKRDGHSPDKGLLKSWPTDRPRACLEVRDVGEGFSSVAVVGDKVSPWAIRATLAYVFAVSRKDGSKAWQPASASAEGGGGYPGPRCTPTVDGDLVYAIGPVRRSRLRQPGRRDEKRGESISPRTSRVRAAAGATRSRHWSMATSSFARPAARKRPSSRSTRRRAKRFGRAIPRTANRRVTRRSSSAAVRRDETIRDANIEERRRLCRGFGQVSLATLAVRESDSLTTPPTCRPWSCSTIQI